MPRFSTDLTPNEKHFLQKLYIKAQQRPIRCYNSTCKSKEPNAISSHVLQKNGVLSHLADQSGKIWELAPADFFKPHYVRWRSTPIEGSEVFTFYGFCGSCDSKLFREIELFPPDLMNIRRHQLLFTYRSVVHELHKIDLNLLFYKNVFDSSIHERIKKRYENKSQGFDIGRKRLLIKKNQIERELFNPIFSAIFGSFIKKDFFVPLLVEKLNIALSATYSDRIIISDNLSLSDAPLHYLHVIPKGEQSVVLFGGSHADASLFTGVHYSALQKLSGEVIQTLITDIMLQRAETWCLSGQFYLDLKRRGLVDTISRLKNSRIDPGRKNGNSFNFNIFN
jgi:hypothetical protein